MRYFLFLLLSISLLSPLAAHADDTTMPYEQQIEFNDEAKKQLAMKGGFFENLDRAAKELSAKFNTATGAGIAEIGMGYGNRLRDAGLVLAGALALMYLFYETLQFIGGKNASMLTVLFDVGIPAVITAMLIQNYPANMAMFNGLLDLLRNIADSPINKIMPFYGGVLHLVSNAISNSFANFAGSMPFAVTNMGLVAASLLDVLATLALALIILVIAFSSIAEVLGLLLLGPFLYAVGAAFGPILLAGLVTPWTRSFTVKWVGFVIGSAVVTGVLSLIIGIATTIFTSLGLTSYASGGSSAASLAVAAVLLMAVNSLISQAPSIASALIPGSIGANTGGGGGVTKGAQKMSRQASKGGAKIGGGAAVRLPGKLVAGFKKAKGIP